jgi:sulfopropanediol 3-dehydrogenase
MIRYLKSGQSAATKAESTLQVRNTVEAILADIAGNGERAVRQYSEKFDKWSPSSFQLSDAEIAKCVRSLPTQVIEDIQIAQTQIRNLLAESRAARRQVKPSPASLVTRTSGEQRGRYVPGGRYPMWPPPYERRNREGRGRQAHHRDGAAF